MKVGVALLAALIITGTASAAGSSRDMVSAMKSLHYPLASPVKLGCRTAGAGFACKATYRHHRIRRFYAEWRATGGFICAGAKPATCKILRHGFIPTGQTDNSADAALLASRGYMAINYNDPQPFSAKKPCVPSAAASSWSFCYALDTSDVNVTVTVKQVKTGYITTAIAILY